MKTLDEAYSWYETTRTRLKNLQKLAKRYWDDLPWENVLDRDNDFRNLEADEIETSVLSALLPLDDLAVLVLFSVFEAVIRTRLEEQVSPEARSLIHPALQKAGQDTLDQIADGSFGGLMEYFKSVDPNLVEEVNQVRRYRNWVAHGRRDEQPPSNNVTPRITFDRLNRFLLMVSRKSEP
jgi:hypothetical protein